MIITVKKADVGIVSVCFIKGQTVKKKKKKKKKIFLINK